MSFVLQFFILLPDTGPNLRENESAESLYTF